jgi:hypothetical protein
VLKLIRCRTTAAVELITGWPISGADVLGAHGSFTAARNLYCARFDYFPRCKVRLPAVYPDQAFSTSGGLASYGSDLVNDFRKAAGYVDRILKGAKPADLPVQVPTEYKLVINQKTAKALGLAIPPSLIARAAEVIE